MSVIVFVGINVINIYNNNELMISSRDLTISSNNCNSNFNCDDNCDDNMVLSIILGMILL